MSSTSAANADTPVSTPTARRGLSQSVSLTTDNRQLTTVSLKSRLAELNAARARKQIGPITYAALGAHIGHAKSTAASIVNGCYNAKTRWELEALLAEFIMSQLNEIDPQPQPRPFFNEVAAAPPRERNPRTVAIAIPSDGRFSFRGRRYDAGFLFRGATQMVRFDRARNANITLDRLTYCIEPIK